MNKEREFLIGLLETIAEYLPGGDDCLESLRNGCPILDRPNVGDKLFGFAYEIVRPHCAGSMLIVVKTDPIQIYVVPVFRQT